MPQIADLALGCRPNPHYVIQRRSLFRPLSQFYSLRLLAARSAPLCLFPTRSRDSRAVTWAPEVALRPPPTRHRPEPGLRQDLPQEAQSSDVRPSK
ncbi:hypothetical protein NDU88_002357 [Pleurodeles waltl]|uniref:Uncharacterized protein n=1 Tax=Pleurodeles waltl TaxID=8319 RepID=A0AAV7UAX0_PLEWA|nr:hypothetical protein NDU88_002357 [Pleurodeles waltl]